MGAGSRWGPENGGGAAAVSAFMAVSSSRQPAGGEGRGAKNPSRAGRQNCRIVLQTYFFSEN